MQLHWGPIRLDREGPTRCSCFFNRCRFASCVREIGTSESYAKNLSFHFKCSVFDKIILAWPLSFEIEC
jgi:hypothetical protein